MPTYASAVTGPSASIVTSIASAVSNAQALATALAPGVGGPLTAPGSFLAGVTLQNLATNNSSWKCTAADARIALQSAIVSLAQAGRQFGELAAILSTLGSLD
jgi:hypothetical protein